MNIKKIALTSLVIFAMLLMLVGGIVIGCESTVQTSDTSDISSDSSSPASDSSDGSDSSPTSAVEPADLERLGKEALALFTQTVNSVKSYSLRITDYTQPNGGTFTTTVTEDTVYKQKTTSGYIADANYYYRCTFDSDLQPVYGTSESARRGTRADFTAKFALSALCDTPIYHSYDEANGEYLFKITSKTVVATIADLCGEDFYYNLAVLRLSENGTLAGMDLYTAFALSGTKDSPYTYTLNGYTLVAKADLMSYS